jgi:hypothetical protein
MTDAITWKIVALGCIALLSGMCGVLAWLIRAFLQDIRDELREMNGKVGRVFERTDENRDAIAKVRTHIAETFVTKGDCATCRR